MGGGGSSPAPAPARDTVSSDKYAPPAAEDPVKRQLGIKRPGSSSLLGPQPQSTPLIG